MEESKEYKVVLAKLSEMIEFDENDFIRIQKDIKNKKKFHPVILKKNISWDEMAKIQVNIYDLPGIVIDENANFRHLLGYLKTFFKKMGYPDARFRPAYFPYTEFTVEIDVLHTVHKTWFELGGAGIFRPELVKPLMGIDVPVLAWGPGFDRIILEFFEINDIRDLYKNDLKQLREIKDWSR